MFQGDSIVDSGNPDDYEPKKRKTKVRRRRTEAAS